MPALASAWFITEMADWSRSTVALGCGLWHINIGPEIPKITKANPILKRFMSDSFLASKPMVVDAT